MFDELRAKEKVKKKERMKERKKERKKEINVFANLMVNVCSFNVSSLEVLLNNLLTRGVFTDLMTSVASGRSGSDCAVNVYINHWCVQELYYLSAELIWLYYE